MIKYIKGDLFDHLFSDTNYDKIIVPHIVNNIGVMGAGFVVPLAKHFPKNRSAYISNHKLFNLGEVMYYYDKNVLIANMFAQDGISSRSSGNRKLVNDKPIRYGALALCMNYIAYEINHTYRYYNVGIFAPKFGSGLAMGDWGIIEGLIDELWGDFDVKIFEL